MDGQDNIANVGSQDGRLPMSEATFTSHPQGACDEPSASPKGSFDQDIDGTRCLFCHAKSPDFDSNISHMLQIHSFLVPEQHRLQVDMEILITYLDLVISGYSQCLYCMTQRSSGEAARQHMMAKGHCKIDVASQDSEFRDFYELELDEAGEEQGPSFLQVDDASILLPSGTILSNRMTHSRRYRPRRPLDTTAAASELADQSSSSAEPSGATVTDQSVGGLRPAERRELALGTQLARLRASDRSSLLHLTSAQQRSQLSTQNKQISEARRAQRAMEALTQRKGNKTLMKHFSPDTTARPNG
ncbi:hypothetical protein LTR08_005676 [Meristemomyces frigidus]|nr:hypothetical protein LTR08_005676 [Meristemomyces frigidus]